MRAQFTPATVDGLLAARRLTLESVSRFALRDDPRGVEMPYFGLDGKIATSRIRKHVETAHPTIWARTGGPLLPYTTPAVIHAARRDGTLVVAEGETDVLTLVANGVWAIGIPGGTMTHVLTAEYVEGISRIEVIREPGMAGEKFPGAIDEQLAKVGWRGELRVIDLHACFGVKDPSDLYVRAPEQFKDAWAGAQAQAAPFNRAAPATTELFPPFESEREAVDVSEIDLPKLTEQAIEALVAANETPVLFRQLGRVVRVDLDEDQRPIIKLVSNEVMRHAMARAVPWVKTRGSGKRASRAKVEPPKVVVEDVLASPELPFPGLRGITASPFFTRSGELVVSKGYDPASRLFLALDDAVEIPEVPIAPTQDDVRAAVATIDDVFADFPFVDRADRAHAFALMLVPFAREMISGPTPLHLVEAPTVGTGKTLLAQAALQPACGSVQLEAFGRDEEERKKLVMAVLLRGRPAIVFDNVFGKLNSSVLAGILTATEWGDRVLGASSYVTVTNRTVWVATTNNASLSTEIARRSVPIRIDAQSERPYERNIAYRHPALLDYEHEHRGEIIAAALTILRAWIVAGKPAPERKLGSYEAWAKVIGGALMFAGVEGFLENIERLYESADEEGAALRSFVESWAIAHQGDDVKASDLYAIAESSGLDLGRGDPSAQKKRLGLLLRAQRDCVFGAHCIERRARVRGTQLWRLKTRKNLPLVASGGRSGESGVDGLESYKAFPHTDLLGTGHSIPPHPTNFASNPFGLDPDELAEVARPDVVDDDETDARETWL